MTQKYSMVNRKSISSYGVRKNFFAPFQ